MLAALAVAVIVGGLLGRSSPVTAQSAGQSNDPTFFPATGYRISSPAIFSYFQQHGGTRTFGLPISASFPLQGAYTQIFQRQVLQIRPDGSLASLNILDPGVLPISHLDGLSFPPADPDLLGAAPVPSSEDSISQALAFVEQYVPDQWNDLQVNFLSTYMGTVTCADAFGADPCDPTQLAAMALEVWGLPTSQPTADPNNDDFIYQRFQRGILHFSASTGMTQGLLVGDWFKRVLLGTDLPADVQAQLQGSRFLAQYAPAKPLGLQRPNDLPDTTLAQAFNADTLTAAQATLPTDVAGTATAVSGTATAAAATSVALEATQVASNATAVAATATAATSGLGATPAAVVSNIPPTIAGCLGDEQMWFVPRKPYVGTHIDISVTSQRHHDVRYLKLTGPLDPGPAIERLGPLGFEWTWTVVPTVADAFYQWTFYADGLHPCITSGFPALEALGTTPTPTATAEATSTPGATSTPTATPVPAPTISNAPSSGACSSVLTINGTNFGSPPSSVGTTVELLGGPTNAGTPKLLSLISGSNTVLTVELPSSGLVAGSNYSLQVVNNGGGSNLWPFTITTTC
jgi:hypothetical protein